MLGAFMGGHLWISFCPLILQGHAWGRQRERREFLRIAIGSVFSIAIKNGCMLSCIQLFATPWTLYPTRLISPWNLPGRNTGWVATPFSRGSAWPRDWTCVSCMLYLWATWEAHCIKIFPVSQKFFVLDRIILFILIIKVATIQMSSK